MLYLMLLDVAPPPAETAGYSVVISLIIIILLLGATTLVGAFVVFLIWRKRRQVQVDTNLQPSSSNQS